MTPSEGDRNDGAKIVLAIEMMKRLLPDEYWISAEKKTAVETWQHAMGKFLADRVHPLPGDYLIEKGLGTRRPDLIIEPDYTPFRGYAVEFVCSPQVDIQARVENSLQYGYCVFIVILDDEEGLVKDTSKKLAPFLDQDHQFGSFCPEDGDIEFGNPISFENYKYYINSDPEGEVLPWGIQPSRGWELRANDNDELYVGTFKLPENRFRDKVSIYALKSDGSKVKLVWLNTGKVDVVRGIDAVDLLYSNTSLRIEPATGCRTTEPHPDIDSRRVSTLLTKMSQ